MKQYESRRSYKSVSWHPSCKPWRLRKKKYKDFMIMNVNAEKGPYTSIAAAVKVANPHSTILVASGLYRDNIVIT